MTRYDRRQMFLMIKEAILSTTMLRSCISFFILFWSFIVASDVFAEVPAWQNYTGVPFSEVRVNGQPLDQIQADGQPDQDINRFKSVSIPRWEPSLPKSRFDPYAPRTKKYQPSVPSPTYVWLDNHNLLATVWRFGEWEAADGELPKIILIDADAGRIDVTQYRGQVACVASGRMVVVESPRDGAGIRLVGRPGTIDYSMIRVGKFGEKLAPILPEDQDRSGRPIFERGSCESAPKASEFPGGEHLSVLRLSPGGGYVANENFGSALLPPGSEPLSHDWIFFDEQKHPISRWNGKCRLENWPRSQREIQFLPFLGGYFIDAIKMSGSSVGADECPYIAVKPNGKIVPLFFPTPLILKWKRALGLFMTAAGPAWAVEKNRSSDRRSGALTDKYFYASNSGLYVQDGFRLVRVLEGVYSRASAVSPDGCRALFYQEPAGMTSPEIDGGYDEYRNRKIVSINFCERGK